jgi:hypothetical protein
MNSVVLLLPVFITGIAGLPCRNREQTSMVYTHYADSITENPLRDMDNLARIFPNCGFPDTATPGYAIYTPELFTDAEFVRGLIIPHTMILINDWKHCSVEYTHEDAMKMLRSIEYSLYLLEYRESPQINDDNSVVELRLDDCIEAQTACNIIRRSFQLVKEQWDILQDDSTNNTLSRYMAKREMSDDAEVSNRAAETGQDSGVRLAPSVSLSALGLAAGSAVKRKLGRQ